MLKDEFDERMQQVYRNGKREGRYSAPLFASMLKEKGGLETAKWLIQSPAVAPGFTALWERKRLDLTAEAVIAISRLPDGRRSLARLAKVMLTSGRKASVALVNGVLQVVVAPKPGAPLGELQGRPSSRRVELAFGR